MRLGGRELAHRLPDLGVTEEIRDEGGEPGMGHLAGEELEKTVELVRIAAHARGEPGRIGIGRLDRADFELQAVVEALNASEHAHRVPFGEAAVEQLDVVPDPAFDLPVGSTSSSTRYGAPFRVVRRCLRATAYTPSTVRSAVNSAKVLTG